MMRSRKTAEKTELDAIKLSSVNSTSLIFGKSSKAEFGVTVSDKGLKYEYSGMLDKSKSSPLCYQMCGLEGWRLFVNKRTPYTKLLHGRWTYGTAFFRFPLKPSNHFSTSSSLWYFTGNKHKVMCKFPTDTSNVPEYLKNKDNMGTL